MDVEGMQNARLGVIYLWQGTKFQSPLANVALGGVVGVLDELLGFKDKTLFVPDQATDAAAKAINSVFGLDKEKSVWAKILEWATRLGEALLDKIKEVFGDIGDFVGEIKKIALFVTTKVYDQVASLISNAANLVQGLWKTTVAFCEKIGNLFAKIGVKLVDGHPSTVVKSIEAGITRALLAGLYETAKSAAVIGLNVASAGATKLVEVIAAALEATAKILWRVAEALIIRNFCQEAKMYWVARGEHNAIHLDSSRFDAWLKSATGKVPVIAAVTLGSNIAGDKMRFLQMYTGTGAVISQDQFNAGVAYLDRVKREGARLLEHSGLEFHSDDPIIEGLHKLACSHDAVFATTHRVSALFRRADKVASA